MNSFSMTGISAPSLEVATRKTLRGRTDELNGLIRECLEVAFGAKIIISGINPEEQNNGKGYPDGIEGNLDSALDGLRDLSKLLVEIRERL